MLSGRRDCRSGPLANRPRRSRAPLFRLFYQVEIRRRQLHSMISHSLRAVNVQCDHGNCVVVDTANPDSEYGGNWSIRDEHMGARACRG
jgi:hypothetical protein